jgi:hypothetical protein
VEVIGEVFEFYRKIHVFDLDLGGGPHLNGRKIEYTPHSCVHKKPADPLGHLRGRGDDPYFNALFLTYFFDPAVGFYDQTARELLALFFGIRIKGCLEDISPLLEILIFDETGPQIPHTDDTKRHPPVCGQNVFNFMKQLSNIVSHAADTKLSEIGQVLPHLSRLNTAQISQSLRGNNRGPTFQQFLKGSGIKRQSLDGGCWYFDGLAHGLWGEGFKKGL